MPFAVTLGRADYPDAADALSILEQAAGRLVALDAAALAERAGSAKVAGTVLLGALCATGALPVKTETVKQTVLSKVPGRYRTENEKAFIWGENAVRKG